jgi:hypothetical protein
MSDDPKAEDAALEAALARALGPGAGDTAPLSRAVLTRLAARPAPRRQLLAEVLADPRPAAGLMLAALLVAGAVGYALLPAELEELALLMALVGPGL